ncbi:protein cereblon-like [Styela clava]
MWNFYFVVIMYVTSLGLSHRTQTGKFICKRCGETVAQAEDLVSIPSKLALQRWNKTILGKPHITTQKFENPQGAQFEVVTFSEASVTSNEDAHTEATWFPGYSWRISACSRCNFFLGWKYQPVNFNHMTFTENDKFYGLIMDHIIQDIDSDSLVIIQHPNAR